MGGPMRPGCTLANCPFEPIPAWVRVLTALLLGSFILIKPILRGLGIDEGGSLAAAAPNVSLLGPAVALVLCSFYAYYHVTERSYLPFFFMDMVSLPGIFYAFMLAHSGA